MSEMSTGHCAVRSERVFHFGPLVIDFAQGRALVYGEDLLLNEDELEALWLLAQRAGEPITLEWLYEAVWNGFDGSDKRSEAKAGMDNVVKRLNAAGKGLARIEALFENSFMFRL